jgi:hypothetical protein
MIDNNHDKLRRNVVVKCFSEENINFLTSLLKIIIASQHYKVILSIIYQIINRDFIVIVPDVSWAWFEKL